MNPVAGKLALLAVGATLVGILLLWVLVLMIEWLIGEEED